MKNKILSFLLAIVMILTVVPALSVSAAEPVDLIHKAGTSTLRDGVFTTYEGGTFNSSTHPGRAVNNQTNDAWLCLISPGVKSWFQVNLPYSSQWTNVKVILASNDGYRNAYYILASNDPSFETGTYTVLAEGASFANNMQERTVEISDSSKFTTPYRYLRIIPKTSKRIGVTEIDITGYEPVFPTTDGLTDLAQKPDVYAKAALSDANAYKAQQVLDGSDTTAYTVTGATSPELMVDLRRESAIKIIEFTPASGNEAFRKGYEIHTSNSPTFASYDIICRNENAATADGAAVKAYVSGDKLARYVRIKSNGTDLGVAELKVWGTEPTFVLENMVSPAYVTATTGANPDYTADNDVSTVWSSAEEAQKTSITYELAGTNPVTSVMLLPANGEESRKNFNIYGSMSGDFTDAELIKTVGETPLALGQYEIVTLDEPKAYKKIKIEKATEPSAAESLAFREVKVIYNSLDAVVKVESTSPSDGATGVSNMGSAATSLVEVELNRNIVSSSINPTNVVIKDVTDGNDAVLTGWTPYEVSGKKFSIDISKLDSNKTYEVTLTTNVETTSGNLNEEYTFSFTTGSILKVPYDPDKVLVNIVAGKRIWGNGHSSYPLDRILDGNNSNFMITSGAPKIQLDLGNFYDIVAVEMVPRAGDPDNTIPNLNILADDTEFNFAATDLMDKAIATYPATNVGAYTAVLATPVSARYLGIYRASTYLGLGEFRAYVYVDKNLVDIGAWKVNDSTTTTEFSAAGTYTFSAPVNNMSQDATSYYMTVFAYDANGKMLEKSNEVKAVASGNSTLSAGVTLDATDFAAATEITAVLYKAQNDAKMVVDAKTITKTGATPVIPAAAPDAVKLEYKAKTANERVAVQVLGPKADGSGYDFDTIGEVSFNTELCYSKGSDMLAKDEVITFNFKVADPADYGEYSIRTTVTKQNGTTEVTDSYLLYLSQAQIDGCVAEFVAFPQTLTMRQLIDKWTDNLNTGYKYISMADLPSALATSIPAGFDTMFEYLCDLYVADGEMSEITDVVDCINAAYVMAMYDANDAAAAKTALTKYTGDINGLYSRKDATTEQEILDTAKYALVFNNLKSNIQDAATLKTVMQWTAPLSLVQGGTRENVQYAIENYNEVLGCDLSYAQANNVTLAQAVMKIETSKASDYYNNFANAFVAAVDAVVAGRGTPGETPISPSPIVSPGVGSISTKPTTGNDDVKPQEPITPPVDAEPEKEIPFNDIENIVWAKDYIADLYELGIVSGDGDGSFHPERQVSREEFLKMLIESLDIDVASKEAASFEDCDPDAWYYPYVQIASTNKITKGIDRKHFGIGQSITRQDMAVLLSKALAIKNVTAMESEYEFKDVDAISEYAQIEVSKMYALGLISGFEDGTFAPKAYTTRAQAAVIIGRALEILGGASK